MTGTDLITVASTRIGDAYILGSIAPKNDANYHGPWDCAEFVSWAVYQVTGKLYGCTNDQSAYPATADAGTEFWERDANSGYVIVIGIDEAINTPGAILLREATPQLDGHVVLSKGTGTTVEARGHVWGVCEAPTSGRNWDKGILIPGISYTTNPATVILSAGGSNDPGKVKALQTALNAAGYNLTVDGIFGSGTYAAVKDFQTKNNLTPDGIAGPNTLKALGL